MMPFPPCRQASLVPFVVVMAMEKWDEPGCHAEEEAGALRQAVLTRRLQDATEGGALQRRRRTQPTEQGTYSRIVA